MIADGPCHVSGKKTVQFGVRGDVNVNLTAYGALDDDGTLRVTVINKDVTQDAAHPGLRIEWLDDVVVHPGVGGP